MRAYISGKITGLPFEEVKMRFEEAEGLLKNLGFEPVSPLDNGLDDTATWIEHMCADIKLLHECDVIFMLENWGLSTGAKIEYDFAVRVRKTILFETTILKSQEAVLKIQEAIHETTGLKLSQYSTKSRKREGFYARMLFVHHCKRERMMLSDIAKYINRSYSAINHFLNKYNDEVKFNSEFRVLSEQVNRLLT